MPENHDSEQQRKDIGSTVGLLWSTALTAQSKPRQTLRVDTAKTVPQAHDLVVRSKLVRQSDEPQDQPADYELGGLLGEGGMGLVYDARQTAVDRRVAVKMLKPDINKNDQLREQFLHEAVVTGELDHPNIVPIYDLSSTEEGVLFYAMKQIRGTLWSDVIREYSESQNLEILLRVCDAISFAHARKIVHRDLKPENIKLGDFGEVFVLDWGLAMACSELPEKRLSALRVLGGTPAYMAPEMTVGPLDRIGPGSDIYLLGAILFEILTGQPPHDGKTATDCLVAAGTNEIVETEQTGELIEIAWKAMSTKPADRHHSVKEFQKSILDYQQHRQSNVLVQQANEMLDRAMSEDTYEDFSQAIFGFRQALSLWPENQSAATGLEESQVKFSQSARNRGDFDLALSQLEQDEPQHAEMIEAIQQERQQRESQRRRLTVIRRTARVLVLVFCALLAAALIWVTDAERRATRQAERVLQQFERAERNHLLARQAVDEMLSEVAQGDLKEMPHMDATRKRLLERALIFYQTFLSEEPTDPRVQQETAKAYSSVAEITGLLGQLKGEQEAYRKSIELYRQLEKNDPQETSFQEEMAVAYNELGESYRQTGQTDEAEKAYGQAVKIQQELSSQSPTARLVQQELARTTYNLALLYFETDRIEEASRLYQQSIDLLEPLVAALPTEPTCLQHLARVLVNRGNLAKRTNQPSAAEADYRRAIGLLNQILHHSPQNREIQSEQATFYRNLGNLLQAMPDRRAESLAVYQNSVTSFEQLVKDFPDFPQYRRGWANTLNSLAALNFLEKKTEQAQQQWGEALEIYRPLVDLYPEKPDYQSEFGQALANLGYLLIEKDKTASRQNLLAAINYQQQALQMNPQHPVYRTLLASHVRSLVIGYAKWNQHQESLETAKQLLQIAPSGWQPCYYTARQIIRSVDQLQQDGSLSAEQRERLPREGRELALSLLTAAVEKGFSDLKPLQTDPLFDPLRKEPGFLELITTLKTPPNQD